MNLKCIFKHKWIDTDRKTFTFDEKGDVILCESPLMQCRRCGKSKGIEKEYLMSELVSRKYS